MKKKKIASTTNAIAADPKAERIPIKMPLPVEPEESPLAATTCFVAASEVDERLEMTFCRLSCICFCERADAVWVAFGIICVWEETRPSGDVDGVAITDMSVEGRPASAPGPDASGLCIVH